MNKIMIISFFLTSFLFITGCGVTEKNIKDVEKRIEALSSKGVPDSSLSQAKVFLYQAKDSKERGNFKLAQQAKKGMNIQIKKAEAKYEEDMARLKPWIQSQKSSIASEISGLTELNKRHADSVIAIVDSFVNIGWLLNAEALIKEFVLVIPKLKADENYAVELRPKIPGRWVCKSVTKHVQDKTVHAVEKKIFNFKKDGTVKLIETKKGKSSPFFKEDWQFVSSGNYKLKGDTIVLFIERFKASKQHFWDLKKVNGKKKWVFKKEPPYDSTITDGSQDRFITYNDLTLDFARR